MSNVPDNYDAFDAYDREQERKEREWVRRLPRCSNCGHPIRDEECWVIGDEIYCEECIDGFRDDTDKHMED